jgi:hypothetical protein
LLNSLPNRGLSGIAGTEYDECRNAHGRMRLARVLSC